MKQQLLNLALISVVLWMMPAWGADKPLLLDERVQSLKYDIMALNRDLAVLEEELLFPDSAQMSVFLSVESSEGINLDTVQLTLDGKVIANHLYSQTEVVALRRGGVQRLYLGILKSGEHELLASYSVPETDAGNNQHTASLSFKKGPQAKFVELKIRAEQSGSQAELTFREWE